MVPAAEGKGMHAGRDAVPAHVPPPRAARLPAIAVIAVTGAGASATTHAWAPRPVLRDRGRDGAAVGAGAGRAQMAARRPRGRRQAKGHQRTHPPAAKVRRDLRGPGRTVVPAPPKTGPA